VRFSRSTKDVFSFEESPEPRPDVNRGEDPHRVFFVADDRPNFVCLKLRNGEGSYFPIIVPTLHHLAERARMRQSKVVRQSQFNGSCP
jgi:hypothetical protein